MEDKKRNNYNRKNNDVRYEDIEVITINFGNNNFFEIVLRKAIAKDQEGNEVENVFAQIVRGYYTPENEKRYKRGQRITIPANEIENVANALIELSKTQKN